MIDELKKFISYFFVGGMAAIVEWISFAIFNSIIGYMFATIIAFILATTFNYFLGKKMTFKNYKQTKKDIIGVFVVSGIGLLLNILFMYIQIELIHITFKMAAKIIATGLVFIWNYISRRIFIYKEEVN